MARITLTNLTKRWGEAIAVDDQSLTVEDGTFMVLLGPSGCGKTTTMRMIAGLETPTSGRILFDADDVTEVPTRSRDIAMVFQNYGLYPHMSVAENIGYPLKLRGIARGERSRLVADAAAKVELGPYLDRMPAALSGGQRQRVALARAIVRRPRVFLMDEPLSNLDAKLRVTMRAEIKHLQHALAVTTVYVTHDQIEAMTLADRVAVMDRGRIRQLGPPGEIYDTPADSFVAGFIGSPAMNLIDGDVAAGQFRAPGIAVAVPSTDGPVTLGVRPEDLTLAEPATAPIQGSVFAVEPTGDAVLLTLTVGPTRIAARVPREWRAREGERVGLAPDAARIHLFDRMTGLRQGRSV
jgi:multiple sugar transport system ATP-binding protein